MRFFACVLLVGCGSATLETGSTTPSTLQIGGGSRGVVTLTDLDQVRGVAMSGERVFVATDRGLLSHPIAADEPPRRYLRANGLPSDDVTAVASTPDGTAVVVTPAGLARVHGDEVTPFGRGAPPVGRPTSLLVSENDLWIGGTEGLAKIANGAWVRFGEPATVTTLVPTQDGKLWVGTTRGIWYIEGDVVREHPLTGGMPEGYVRSIVPTAPGQALALLQGPSSSQIGFFDGRRWWGYSLADFSPVVVSLARIGPNVLLVTPGRGYVVTQLEEGLDIEGVPLTPLSRGELRTARAYRARVTPPDEIRPAERTDEIGRNASALAEIPEQPPSLDAPRFVVSTSPLAIPDSPYAAFTLGTDTFLTDANRGVVRYDRTGSRTSYQSRDLVTGEDFQIAVDAASQTWVIDSTGGVAAFREDRFGRVAAPEGVTAQSVASGPGGAYVLTRVDGTNTLRLFRVSSDGFSPIFDRDVVMPEGTEFLGTPFFALTENMTVWAGVRVRDQHGERMRGVAVFSERSPEVVYHHRGATPATDGEGALAMPDEVTSVDVNMPDYAWLPALSGAVRVGNSQAVVFGESRGVRGEVVSDLVVGDGGRVWIAAAEGVGYWENSEVEFRLPRVVQEARPTALAIDSQGNLWGVGQNGVVYFDGTNWQTLTEQSGLPTNELRDVEVDAQDRAWLLATDRVMVFSPRQAASN
jgi:hypothetical protein